MRADVRHDVCNLALRQPAAVSCVLQRVSDSVLVAAAVVMHSCALQVDHAGGRRAGEDPRSCFTLLQLTGVARHEGITVRSLAGSAGQSEAHEHRSSAICSHAQRNKRHYLQRNGLSGARRMMLQLFDPEGEAYALEVT